MKERIVIPKDKIKVLTSGSRFPANGYFTFYKEDVEVEKVPESWEELKELCKEIGIDAEEDYIELFGVLVGSNILFCNDGAIMLNTDCCFAEKVSVERMWQIIKSLIGEE